MSRKLSKVNNLKIGLRLKNIVRVKCHRNKNRNKLIIKVAIKILN